MGVALRCVCDGRRSVEVDGVEEEATKRRNDARTVR